MVAAIINLFIIGIFHFFKIDILWFLIAISLMMVMYRIANKLPVELFAYVKMFKIEIDLELLKETVLFLMVLLYFYFRTGYFSTFNTAITFPFTYILLFFFLYQGIYSQKISEQVNYF